MDKDIKKIVVVGGGSSGWMVASALVKYFSKIEIIVLDSSKHKTMGVGESTTAMMKHFINGHLKIKDEDFMPKTDAIYKLAIQVKNFYKNNESFIYPFGNPYEENLDFGITSWKIVKHFYPEIKKEDFYASIFPSYHMVKNKTISKNENNEFDNFNSDLDMGYHLNAIKFADYLKNEYCLKRGVKHIDDEIVDVVMDDYGYIKNLKTKEGKEIKADLFIDCTGFKSLLIKKIKTAIYEDLSDTFLNDSAWVTPINYKDIYKEMIPCTFSTALKNGWAWYTPIYSRVGCGYSYSSKFINSELALDEFKQFLNNKDFPIKLSKKEIDSLPFFQVFSKNGHYKNPFVKNVVAIGLSHGFIEPLEGTALYFVSDSILFLIKLLNRKIITQHIRDIYNLTINEKFNIWKDSIASFYAYSSRTDSNYWKHISEKSFLKDMVDVTEKKQPFYGLQDYSFAISYGRTLVPLNQDFYSGNSFISHGFDLSTDACNVEIDRWMLTDKNIVDYEKIAIFSKNIFDKRKEKWSKNAKNSMHIYDYLNKYIYSNVVI